jgi:hypothetical protein
MKKISEKKTILKELRTIPGVGASIAEDLYRLDIHSVHDLKDKSPEIMYEKFCEMQGSKVDRCLLYVFRCAVYYASNETHDEQLLKWWNWKDKR